MKYTFTLLFLGITYFCSAQFTDENYEMMVQLAQYNSAYQYLDGQDPLNNNPEIALAKKELLTTYFVKSNLHQEFYLKDLGMEESLDNIRQFPVEEELSIYSFPVNEVLEKLIQKKPKQYKLHKALAEYYYDVHLRFGTGWVEADSLVLDKMYHNFITVEKNKLADDKTYYVLGYYHTLKSEFEEAISFYKKSIVLNPDNPRTQYYTALCYLYSEKLNEALPYAEKTVELYEDQPSKADAARMTATIYKSIGNNEKALEFYSISNTNQPNNFYTLGNYMELQLKENLIDDAAITAHDFFELDPDNPRIISDIIDIYRLTEHNDAMLVFFKEKINTYKDKKEVLGNIYFHLGQFYLLEKNKKKAIKNLNLAQGSFEGELKSGHEVFALIEEGLQEADKL